MKKKELMTISPPGLTPYLKRIARKDEPVRSQHWRTDRKYRYGRYLRVKEEKGYLVVSVFLGQFVRAGAKHPAYVVYIDKKVNDFITFETDTGKWRKSMLHNLDWPGYTYGLGTYISRSDEKQVCRYLGTERGDYEELECYQIRVREQQLAARYKKKTDVWDEAMKSVPRLPKDWERWILKSVVSEHYIFYKYKRGGATQGYCTHCGRMVPVKKPRYNETGTCSRCGQGIRYKSIDKSGSVWTETEAAYLLQRCGEGIVLRKFHVCMALHKGDFLNPEINYSETRRFLYDGDFHEEPYYYGDFKNRGNRWIAGKGCNYNGYYYYYYYDPIPTRGKVYPRTLPDLGRKELKQTGLIQWLERNPVSNPHTYLNAWRKLPVLEQILKAGLTRLSEELVENPEKLVWKDVKGGLAKKLEIDSARLKRLRKAEGDINVLYWLQQEKKENLCLPDDLIGWFIGNSILPKDLAFIHDRMSYVQIKNYLVRQKGEREDSIRQVLTTWKDYLSMAKRVRLNVQDKLSTGQTSCTRGMGSWWNISRTTSCQ